VPLAEVMDRLETHMAAVFDRTLTPAAG